MNASSPEEQILAAIAIANDPSNQGQPIQNEAIQFLSKVRSESEQSWRPALSLFVATNDETGTRRFGDEVRMFCLGIVESFLEIGKTKAKLNDDDFLTLREQFVSYLRSEYLYGSAETTAPYIRNKFSYALTLLFLATYESHWPDFFDTVFALLKPPPETGVQPFNPQISIFFFKLLTEISSEVADQLLKNARAFDADRMARDGRIRDLIREKDAPNINQAVLTIIVAGKEKLDRIRAGQLDEKISLMEEVVDLGVRAFASYVPWIDINLTVTPETISLLFSLVSEPSLPIRLATCAALSRIVTKGLKVSSDKLKLLQVLSLGPVLKQLEAQTRLSADGNSAKRGDEAVESYREALAHVTNALGIELLALCNDTRLPPDEVQASVELLMEVIPTALQFLADPYDDTSFNLFPLLTDILTSYKKAKQAAPQTHMTSEKREFLERTLNILIEKLKWDGDEDPDDLDADDKAAFETLRKDIRRSIDSISSLDNDLVTEVISDRAHSTLDAYESGAQLPWEVAELAIYLVFMYGELTGKDKGKGRQAFCLAPNIKKEERKLVDYSEYPLTPQGEMMQKLIQSRISTHPHPTVAMQFFETATRYADFFKVRKEYVLPALEAFLDARGVHHPLTQVRKRVFYLFFRFVQALRIDIKVEHVPAILQAIQDLLTFDVEIPEDFEPPTGTTEENFLTEVLKEPSMFDTQLYMFEAAGALVSALWQQPENQAAALQTIMNLPLTRLSSSLQVPLTRTPSDYLNILAVHHSIQALGSIPKGFPEFPSPVPDDYIMPPIAEFRQMAEAILFSLTVMGQFRVVREAARFAFGRIIFAAGPTITEYIPRLMTSLLSFFEPTEFVEFIGFIAHMTHKLQTQIRDVLEEIMIPLTNHVSSILSQPITGTDDKVARVDTKKAFLTFLNTVMSSNLGSVFVSQRNASSLESFLEAILSISADASDPLNQKLALTFLTKFVSLFGYATPPADPAAASGVIIVPGVEQFLYQRVLVVAFGIPFLPDFNVKDGQASAALNEVGNVIQTIAKVRGEEALNYISTVFLPSQNTPPETTMELTNNLRTLDKRGFQKYFSDFVKAARSS